MVRIRLLLDCRRFPVVMGKGIQVFSFESDIFHIGFSVRDGEFD